MLRKLKLYGELAEFVGHKEFEVKADTLKPAAEAVGFVAAAKLAAIDTPLPELEPPDSNFFLP